MIRDILPLELPPPLLGSLEAEKEKKNILLQTSNALPSPPSGALLPSPNFKGQRDA